MRVSISNPENHREARQGFPPNLLRFRMDRDEPFYRNDDYIYDFWPTGLSRTYPKPLGFRPSEREFSRQRNLQFMALVWRRIERPPIEITSLAENIFRTGHIDPNGVHDIGVAPISFTSKFELHVIKKQQVTGKEVETAVLRCIAANMGVTVNQLDVKYDS